MAIHAPPGHVRVCRGPGAGRRLLPRRQQPPLSAIFPVPAVSDIFKGLFPVAHVDPVPVVPRRSLPPARRTAVLAGVPDLREQPSLRRAVQMHADPASKYWSAQIQLIPWPRRASSSRFLGQPADGDLLELPVPRLDTLAVPRHPLPSTPRTFHSKNRWFNGSSRFLPPNVPSGSSLQPHVASHRTRAARKQAAQQQHPLHHRPRSSCSQIPPNSRAQVEGLFHLQSEPLGKKSTTATVSSNTDRRREQLTGRPWSVIVSVVLRVRGP